ncbi:MAG TPA: DNA replication/repair protein RecF [Rectinemataceae bacterium]
MPFRMASFSSFRNLEDCQLDVDAGRIFLIGENGQGKTNFLEAVYYLCCGTSFRGPVDALIPKSAQGSARKDTEALGLGGSVSARAGFGLRGIWRESGRGDFPDENISLKVSGGQKDIRLNDKPVRDRKELVAHCPAVIFCHEDFSFAAGDPERRRFFFDQCAGMVFHTYIDSLRSYKRVLKQRNAALKENARGLLEAIDPQLARYGLELMDSRQALLEKFEAIFPGLYEEVSLLGKAVMVDYSPSWPRGSTVDGILAHLEARRDSEILLGTTRSGPHRDRWNFFCEGDLFTETASTGQLRLVSLVLRIVQARIYADSAMISGTGPRWPVLLLDDVLLELDTDKRRRFLGLLPGKDEEAQSFFTFLPGEPWTEYSGEDTIIYRVADGGFKDKKRL